MRITPIPGVIGPREQVRLNLDPPLADNERPILLSPYSNVIDMEFTDPGVVVLTSRANGPAFFVCLVAPASLSAIAMIPWRDLPRLLPTLIPQIPWGQIVAELAGRFMGNARFVYTGVKPPKDVTPPKEPAPEPPKHTSKKEGK
jgi:hypothetical protein